MNPGRVSDLSNPCPVGVAMTNNHSVGVAPMNIYENLRWQELIQFEQGDLKASRRYGVAANTIQAMSAALTLSRGYVADALEAHRHTDGEDLLRLIDELLASVGRESETPERKVHDQQ